MNKSQYAAAALAAATCLAWIIWPRPVFTAMVLAVVLYCLAFTAAAAVRVICRRGAK